MNLNKLFIGIILFLSIATVVFANGVGNEIKKSVNGFSFEFGMEPKELKASEMVIMSLSIYNTSTGNALKIDGLWIRISKGNEIFFTSSDFRIAEQGPMFFSYTFKESGEYVIDFSFKNNDEDVKTNFTISVKDNSKPVKNLIFLVAVFVFGFITANIISKVRSRKGDKYSRKDKERDWV